MSFAVSAVVGGGLALSGATVAGLSVAATAIAGGLAAGAVVNTYQQQKKSMQLQQQSQAQSLALARENASQQEQAINKANAKSPNVGNILAGNAASARGGGSATMLTGPQGVDPNSLALSKNSLLGS